ncbi:MAG: hypothetical protein U5J97_11110 [Trueperaceae bacterium]|nr:hypothetical protein [Trueperaceae bacterium]
MRDDPTRGRERPRALDPANGTATVLRAFAVASSNDVDPATDVADDPAAAAVTSVERALASGWDALAARNADDWERFWQLSDVRIDGDDDAQRALRFAIYHNRIATPEHSDRLPIGARGLSCQAYQGAAFWDQEAYNLDVFLHTRPEVARRILSYRWRTLPGARRKAERLGYHGAFYAWISGDDGEELCPDWFFREVVTGRPIRNHFNDWQMHVSPDVAVAVRDYLDATGDESFLIERGAEIVFEVARFLASFVVWIPHRRRWEIRRVLGPDEYHENVDDNAFTNEQSRSALVFALETYARLRKVAPDALADLRARIELRDEELAAWRDVADRLHLPGPDARTGLIEQFRGYFDLVVRHGASAAGPCAPIGGRTGEEQGLRRRVAQLGSRRVSASSPRSHGTSRWSWCRPAITLQAMPARARRPATAAVRPTAVSSDDRRSVMRAATKSNGSPARCACASGSTSVSPSSSSTVANGASPSVSWSVSWTVASANTNGPSASSGRRSRSRADRSSGALIDRACHGGTPVAPASGAGTVRASTGTTVAGG